MNWMWKPSQRHTQVLPGKSSSGNLIHSYCINTCSSGYFCCAAIWAVISLSVCAAIMYNLTESRKQGKKIAFDQHNVLCHFQSFWDLSSNLIYKMTKKKHGITSSKSPMWCLQMAYFVFFCPKDILFFRVCFAINTYCKDSSKLIGYEGRKITWSMSFGSPPGGRISAE